MTVLQDHSAVRGANEISGGPSAAPRLVRGDAGGQSLPRVAQLVEVWMRNTGVEMHPDGWLDSRNTKSKLEAQTVVLEERLQSAGISTRREDSGAVAVIGMCTGEVEWLTPWRNINLLPAVAAMNRSSMLKAFNFFAKDRPFLRYVVATNGPRCSLEDLRARAKSLHRACSKFAALETVRALGITVEYRGTEVTFQREKDGKISCHPHANLVLNCNRFLGDDWRQFLSVARTHFGAWVKDNGRLRDAAEAIKYIAKPGELLDLQPDELAQVHEALLGLHLHQPLGAFAEQRREHEREKVKPVKVHSNGDWRWQLVRKPSRGSRQASTEAGDQGADEDAGEKTAAGAVNVLVSVTTPQPRFRPKMEPCLVVVGYQGDAEGILRRASLDSIAAEVRQVWAGGEASPLSFTPARQLSAAGPLKQESDAPDPTKRHYHLQGPVEGAARRAESCRKWIQDKRPSLVQELFPELARIERARAIAKAR